MFAVTDCPLCENCGSFILAHDNICAADCRGERYRKRLQSVRCRLCGASQGVPCRRSRGVTKGQALPRGLFHALRERASAAEAVRGTTKEGDE